MSIADHVAILLAGSLDAPKAGKAKPDRPEYWGLFAFPPSAGPDLTAACQAAAGGSLAGMRLAPKLHSRLEPDKQFAGIPQDWLIVRMGTGPDFPPALFLLDGSSVQALPINGAKIRADLFAGQKVRVNAHGFAYPPKNGGPAGVSFSLDGVMAVGGGQRRSSSSEGGEPSESVFAKYRAEVAAAPAASTAPATTGNPFQQSAAGTDNPFG
ncbi:hypothetical protein [Xanthomonas phage X2]|nr:hypothetical protein [Xanthomonas phage X2]